ncbi:MAG: hypothetical protein QW096_12810 [Thermofilaceae archaeon]
MLPHRGFKPHGYSQPQPTTAVPDETFTSRFQRDEEAPLDRGFHPQPSETHGRINSGGDKSVAVLIPSRCIRGSLHRLLPPGRAAGADESHPLGVAWKYPWSCEYAWGS